MKQARQELRARGWLSGIRRQQSESRKDTPVIQQKNGDTKIHPIIDWSDRQIGLYLKKHNLPYHPLWEQGYLSVGDWHTTTKTERFFGQKRECGLHECWNPDI